MPRLPKIGEHVPGYGVLVDIKTPPPKKYPPQYIFRDTCAWYEVLLNKEVLTVSYQDYSNDAVAIMIAEAKKYIQKHHIGESSGLELVVKRRDYYTRKVRDTKESPGDNEFFPFGYLNTYAPEAVDLPEEKTIIVWSSRNAGKRKKK